MMKFRFDGKRRKNSSKVAFSSVLPDWKYPASIVSSYKSVSSPITVRLYRTTGAYLNSLAGAFRIELKTLRAPSAVDRIRSEGGATSRRSGGRPSQTALGSVPEMKYCATPGQSGPPRRPE